MTRTAALKLLALIQSFDHRNVGEADGYAWWRALEDVDFDAAQEAVFEHYRESKDWIMPSDVRAGAARIDRRRRGHLRAVQRDAELAADGVTAIEAAPPTGPTVAWQELGEQLRRRAGVDLKSPDGAA